MKGHHVRTSKRVEEYSMSHLVFFCIISNTYVMILTCVPVKFGGYF